MSTTSALTTMACCATGIACLMIASAGQHYATTVVALVLATAMVFCHGSLRRTTEHTSGHRRGTVAYTGTHDARTTQYMTEHARTEHGHRVTYSPRYTQVAARSTPRTQKSLKRR